MAIDFTIGQLITVINTTLTEVFITANVDHITFNRLLMTGSIIMKYRLKLPKAMFTFLRKTHIYLSLLFIVPLCLVVLTGAVLATIPLFRDYPVEPPVEQVLTAIEKFDAQQNYSFAMFRNDIGQIRLVSFSDKGLSMDSVGLATGEIIPTSKMETIYLVVREVHKNLLLKMGWLVELCTWALIIIILTGCIILPRYRISSSLLGYHIGLGLAVTIPMLVMCISAVIMRDMHREVAKKPSAMMSKMVANAQASAMKLPMQQIKTLLHKENAQRVQQIKKTPNSYSITFVDSSNTLKTFDGNNLTQKTDTKSTSIGDIHLGKWGGLPMIALYALASYMAMISMFCAYYRWGKRYWAKKRKARRNVTQRNAILSCKTDISL